MQYSWRKYYEKTKTNPPRPLLVQALLFVNERNTALDVGAGALVDSQYLLREGFAEVFAFDADEASQEIASTITDGRFQFERVGFGAFDYCQERFDLVTGQYAFSFIPPTEFQAVFNQIVGSVRVGGVFVGNIFGERDGWNNGDGTKTFCTKEECRALFANWDVLYFNEVERDDTTALGVPKHWHEFEIIARKKAIVVQ